MPPRLRHALPLIVALLLIGAFMVGGAIRFVARLDALRARRAAGPSWSFPSRLYGDGVALVPGRPLPPAYLVRELAERGYRRVAAPRAPGDFAERAGGFEIVLRGFLDAPDPDGHGGPERVRVNLASGRVARVARLGGLAGFTPPDTAHAPRLEPTLIALVMDENRVRRTWVPLARIPKIVRQAVIASEDRRFQRHFGLDLRSNLRAAVTNVRSGGVRQGASTITQQLARALFLGRERTWYRKANEAVIAVQLELALSKDEILEMYLNSVYWGQFAADGVAGVEEAARAYFGVPVDSLGLADAALLAGIIPAPNAYSPFRNPAVARARRNRVLADMAALGFIDARTAARERAKPLRVRRGPAPPDRFPSFTGYVRDELARTLRDARAENAGLALMTTLDPVWQADAEAGLADGVGALERWRGRVVEPLQGAFFALEPATGFVRAVVGGRASIRGDFNRATQAKRQPGSAIKPIVYATALDPTRPGPRFTPGSTVPDERRDFATPEGPWTPRNDENDYHPTVTLAKALAKSLNLATANLVEAIGPAQVARAAARYGLGQPKAVASIGLGTNEVTLAALTDAFSTFANGGERRDATPLRRVVDGRGHVLLSGPRPAVRMLPPQAAALMTGLLEDVVIFGVSYPLRAVYGFTRPVGGKTGTTNDYRDAWFVGFTPDVAAGVWVGFDQPQSLLRPAAETALPVWAGIMNRLLQGFPPTPFPERKDIVLAWIDPWTGLLGRSDCPSVMRVPFATGTAPTKMCGRDHTADWERIYEARAADSLKALAADSAARIIEAPADSVATTE